MKTIKALFADEVYAKLPDCCYDQKINHPTTQSKNKTMKKMIALSVAFLVTSFALFAQEKAGKKDTAQHAALYTCPMHPDVKSDKPGKCPKCGMNLILSKKEQMKMEVTKTYTCPMHPDVTSKAPGKCPKCGMDLVEKKSSKEKRKKS